MRTVLCLAVGIALVPSAALPQAPSWRPPEGALGRGITYPQDDFLSPPAEGVRFSERVRPLDRVIAGDGAKVLYHAWDGHTETLNEFRGRYVDLLLRDDWLGEGKFTLELARTWVDRLDVLYQHYSELVGREPAGEGLLPIASVIPPGCGWGCGYIGAKGIEVDGSPWSLEAMIPEVSAGFPHGLMGHEMGHNFDVFDAYLTYNHCDAHAWTWFIDGYIGIWDRSGDFGLGPNDRFPERVKNTHFNYLDDPTADWQDCVRDDLCEERGLPPNSIWAGTLFRIAQLHGKRAILQYMRGLADYADSHGPGSTPEEKNDLHVELMAQATGQNLGCYVDQWRWAASSSLRARMANDYGASNPYCEDQDGDGLSRLGGDCDDGNLQVHPGAEDLPDGIDNDCDGLVDASHLREPAGGDFEGIPTIGFPVIVSGEITAEDGDYFSLASSAPPEIAVEICSTPDFQGWVFVYNQDGSWLGYEYVGQGRCTANRYSIPYVPDPAQRVLGVELNNSSIPGSYTLTVRKAEAVPQPAWASTSPAHEVVDSLQLGATTTRPDLFLEPPTHVRYWVHGLGPVGQVPYAASTSLAWHPPAGFDPSGLAYRAQALRDGIPVSSFTPRESRQAECAPGSANACLLGERFRVEVSYTTSESTGVGQVMSFDGARAESDQSAFFYFFDNANFEMGVKMVDACSFNDSFWVFVSGLTNQAFDVTIFDTVTGESRTYSNPLGIYPQTIGATDGVSGFDCTPGGSARTWKPTEAQVRQVLGSTPIDPLGDSLLGELAPAAERATTACAADADTACHLGGRFQVEVDWTTASGTGSAEVMSFGGQRAASDQSSFWWFFDPANFEMGVKMVDACVPPFDAYWVFVSGLTNQGFTVHVTDRVTGLSKPYSNPLGQYPRTIGATDAAAGFPCSEP